MPIAEAYWFSVTSLSKWPPSGHIGFFCFQTVTIVRLWIWSPNFSSTILLCMGRSLFQNGRLVAILDFFGFQTYWIFSCDQAALRMVQSVRPSVWTIWKLPMKNDTKTRHFTYIKYARRWLHKYVGAECGASSFTWYLYQMCNTDGRPSVLTPFSLILCSHHHIIMKFPGVITIDRGDVHAKGQGQRSRSQIKINFALFLVVSGP